ncbi:cation:proton antiporter regulatory subunit [Natronorarus salvus]|uniref:cation:proton antiporter regulatory subunit n=1 Tax=Natronorarus salvus TaxID=3117733 RepID=UPI002F2613F6
MPFDVKETKLPGVGRKYEVLLDEDRTVATVIQPNGTRRVLYRDDPDEDYEELFELTDSQARTIGLFLVGAYYQPVAAKIAEETAGGEHIEWYSTTEDSTVEGKRLDEVGVEAETGATLLGIERAGKVLSTPPDGFVLEAGDRLIVIGTSEAHKRMNVSLGTA